MTAPPTEAPRRIDDELELLAEWLPLSAPERQGLLQMTCPHERLQQLVLKLPEFQEE